MTKPRLIIGIIAGATALYLTLPSLAYFRVRPAVTVKTNDGEFKFVNARAWRDPLGRLHVTEEHRSVLFLAGSYSVIP